LYFLSQSSIGAITPRSAKSGIQPPSASLTSIAPECAMCSAICFWSSCDTDPSIVFTLIPVSFSQSGPPKSLSSAACGPVSRIVVSVTPAYCFACWTAYVAIGSPPAEAFSAAAHAFWTLARRGPATAPAAPSLAAFSSSSLRA
jgi:hypothetical protein